MKTTSFESKSTRENLKMYVDLHILLGEEFLFAGTGEHHP
jgi:hypothetical protein